MHMPSALAHPHGHLWLPSTGGGTFTDDYHVRLASGSGPWAFTDDGRELLDANSGLWHLSLGYGSETLADAVSDAARTIGGSSLFRRSHLWAERLANELAERVPLSADTRVFFTTSGSEASDAALRIALAYYLDASRERIAFIPGAYHGVSVGPLSIMGLDGYTGGVRPVIASLALPSYREWRDDRDRSGDRIHEKFSECGHEIAAIFLEPIQGSGGVERLPADYASVIMSLAERFDIIVVADEIACVTYRAGEMALSRSEQYPLLSPDILLLGKGLTGGVSALSALLVKQKLVSRLLGRTTTQRLPGTTHSGNPVACAAACATLAYLHSDESVKLRASAIEALEACLPPLSGSPIVADVRGWGHMWAVELSPRVVSTSGWIETVTKVALENGLLIHPLEVGSIPIFPPLITSSDVVGEIARRLMSTLAQI